jgi:hypothetical protein
MLILRRKQKASSVGICEQGCGVSNFELVLKSDFAPKS